MAPTASSAVDLLRQDSGRRIDVSSVLSLMSSHCPKRKTAEWYLSTRCIIERGITGGYSPTWSSTGGPRRGRGLLLWNIFQSCILASLQSLNVEHNRPSLSRIDRRPIAGHFSLAIGDRVKNLSNRLCDHFRVVKGGRRKPIPLSQLVRPPGNQPVSRPADAMADGAIGFKFLFQGFTIKA